MTTKLGIELKSKAMYGSFCFHAPTRTLFDAGIGVIDHMGSRIFAIERVFIGHDDWDHCSELIALTGLRAKTKGDTSKRLDVYYPRDSKRLPEIIALIRKCNGDLPYDLNFIQIEAGFKLKLDATHTIEAFPMLHRREILGYKLNEARTRLKSIYRDRIVSGKIDGKPVGEVIKEAKLNGEDTNEVYHASTFAYCLDAVQIDPKYIEGCDLAIMDATFLKAADRSDPTHHCWKEVFDTATEAKVKKVILAHLSVRYHPNQIAEAAIEFRKLYPNVDFEVCFPGKIMEL